LASKTKFSDQIRPAACASGLSGYRLAKLTGLSEPTVSRFFAARAGLSLAALDVLADGLQLEVAVRPRSEHERT